MGYGLVSLTCKDRVYWSVTDHRRGLISADLCQFWNAHNPTVDPHFCRFCRLWLTNQILIGTYLKKKITKNDTYVPFFSFQYILQSKKGSSIQNIFSALPSMPQHCQPTFFHHAQKEWVTVVCKIVHKFASVWCKTALGEVGVSLPRWCAALVLLAPGYWSLFLNLKNLFIMEKWPQVIFP